MKKQLSNLILVITILLSFTSPAQAAGFFDNFWEPLLKLLNLNMSKEVNSLVTPPKAACVAQSSNSFTPAPAPAPAPVPAPAAPAEVEAEVDDGIVTREKIMANFTKLGGDPVALTQSLCFFDKYKSTKFKAAGDPSRPGGIKIDNQRYITINDLNSPMTKSRFFVIDLETGKVKTYFSSHGYGGKKGVPESGLTAEAFSNTDGSYATPRGFFITGTRREGSSDPRWKYSMKLHGLQLGVNDKSFSRAIIMHPFPMMPEGSASSDDPAAGALKASGSEFALSRGCTMLSEDHASEIINDTKAPNSKSGGSLYYNYTPAEKARGPAYCGEEGLMKK